MREPASCGDSPARGLRDPSDAHPDGAVEMAIGDDAAIRNPASSNDIESLLAGWGGGRFAEEEVDWGEPAGREAR
ncbi:MAG: hypothetical protein SOI24_10910 [Coriobacteriales bacterium]|jgi:hypothetical protein